MKKKHAKRDIGILNCFPEGARDIVNEICDKEGLCLYFCSPGMMSSCSGRYYGSCNSIYIDCALDRFSFLEVFVHELAHHEMNKKYWGCKTKPATHGKEFKTMFKSLFEPFLTEDIFPSDLIVGYKEWMDVDVSGWNSYPKRIINKYCVTRKLKNLPDNTHFRSRGLGFIKGRFDEASAKYLCLGSYGCVLFDPNTMVKMI